ncbi:hypothetical protein [Amycolatopsis kentuckyensis]|uniref:hypothetical protein n=1 Tax=Amycolatopsis kentuckyensis TaxID=218823 RepID=UPI00142D9251
MSWWVVALAQEHTAADAILDATEKRVTELYTKAADQLGSANAAVRFAGPTRPRRS